MIRKTSQTTPTSAQIVDGYSTSTTDGYSANYINRLNTYSTDEIDTGKKWIDDKKIYRKIFTFTGKSSVGDKDLINNAFNDLDKIIKFEGTYETSTHIWNINSYYNADFEVSVYYRKNDNKIMGYFGKEVLNGYGIIITEYTKTTD